MEKTLSLIIIAFSLLALFNAGIVYKRSYYLESTDRVDLRRLTDQVEQLDKTRLVDLTHRLVTISRSDSGILLIMNQQFRQALMYLMLCMLAACLLIGYQLIRYLWDKRLQEPD